MANPFLSYGFDLPYRKKTPSYFDTQSEAQSRLPLGPDTFKGDAQSPPEQGYAGRDAENYLSTIRDAYLKEGPASTAYRQHVANIPEDQPISPWRRIGAAILGGAVGGTQGGMAGFQTASGVLDQPNEEALQRWSLKGEGLRHSAELEDKQNLRRVEYANAVRNVAKDETEFRKFMLNYDQKAAEQAFEQKYKTGTAAETGRHNLASEAGLASSRAETGRHNVAEERLGGGRLSVEQGRANVYANESPSRIQRNERIGGAGSAFSPLNITRADRQAVDEVLRENPKWQGFIDPQTQSIKAPKSSGWFGSRAPDLTEYNNFVSAVQRRKQEILLPTDVIR